MVQRYVFFIYNPYKKDIYKSRVKLFTKKLNPRYVELVLYHNYDSSTAACAAAKRAIGTRNGEQLT